MGRGVESPLRIFNIQIINIPPLLGSDLRLVTVSNLCQAQAQPRHPSLAGPGRKQAHHSLDKRKL